MAGILYVVSTPIGNLTDLSPRALETLGAVDLIACEDTRHTRKLLNHFGLKTPTTSYHEHNEETRAPVLAGEIAAGKRIALVSDAGTPLLSDPGYRLVRLCRESGIPVIPIPGPFAAAMAASVSGLATDRIFFGGFLASGLSAVRKQLEDVIPIRATLVFYISPHRLKKTLEAVLAQLGPRRALLIREMTKIHEEAFSGDLVHLTETLADHEPRGEYTLVTEGSTGDAEPPPRIDAAAYVAGLISVRGLSRKDAIRQASQDLGLPKRDVYRIYDLRSEI
jgi:16S rRNA (cytidine1402-2'-O)-methyltransferase